MPYTAKTFVNVPDRENPPPGAEKLDAAQLNRMEAGIASAVSQVETHKQQSGNVHNLALADIGAVASNDSRLSDRRMPVDASVTNAAVADGAAIVESKLALASDALPGVASRRTLGKGSLQAAPGNDTRFAVYLPTHYLAGTVTARTGVERVPIHDPGLITEVRMALGTASTSGGVTVDVRVNGVVVVTLTAAVGATTRATQNLSLAVTTNDYVTVDITSAGTGAANLTVAYKQVLT